VSHHSHIAIVFVGFPCPSSWFPNETFLNVHKFYVSLCYGLPSPLFLVYVNIYIWIKKHIYIKYIPKTPQKISPNPVVLDFDFETVWGQRPSKGKIEHTENWTPSPAPTMLATMDYDFTSQTCKFLHRFGSDLLQSTFCSFNFGFCFVMKIHFVFIFSGSFCSVFWLSFWKMVVWSLGILKSEYFQFGQIVRFEKNRKHKKIMNLQACQTCEIEKHHFWYLWICHLPKSELSCRPHLQNENVTKQTMGKTWAMSLVHFSLLKLH